MNLALFGTTAKQWKIKNPKLKGNIRDHANSEQLLVLANLESLNAESIKLEVEREERLRMLNDTAIHQMKILVNFQLIDKLPNKKELKDKK